MKDKLLIGTGNKGKLAEYKRYFGELMPELELVGPGDLGIEDEPVEDGASFEAVALDKARFYASRSGLLTLVDDGGFEIDALDGEPGVYSRRWPGYEATDEELVKITMKKMAGVAWGDRTARLRLVTVVMDPDGEVIGEEMTSIEGMVAEEADDWIQDHLPFRAVLWIEQFDDYYQNLTDVQHGQINHRREAVERLVPRLREYFKR